MANPENKPKIIDHETPLIAKYKKYLAAGNTIPNLNRKLLDELQELIPEEISPLNPELPRRSLVEKLYSAWNTIPQDTKLLTSILGAVCGSFAFVINGGNAERGLGGLAFGVGFGALLGWGLSTPPSSDNNDKVY